MSSVVSYGLSVLNLRFIRLVLNGSVEGFE